MLPLVTIGLTCFNAHDTITRAVRSAVAQNWPNIEILIVDDNSSDNSWKVLTQLANEHPEVRLIRHEHNCALAGALNTIIQNARGEFISFFDDDDESCPERISEQFERIREYEETTGAQLVLCYSSRSVIRVGESRVCQVALPIGHRAPEPHGPIVADFIMGIPPRNDFCWGTGILGSCTLMARRSTFASVGPFDTTFRRATEMDFAVRAALRDTHFISVERPLVTQFKTTSTDKSVEINFGYWLQLKKKHKAHLSSRRAYWAALALHGMNLEKVRGNRAKAFVWGTLAALCMPLRLLYARALQRMSSQQSRNCASLDA